MLPDDDFQAVRTEDRKRLTSSRSVSDWRARSSADASTWVAALEDSVAAWVMPTMFCDT